MRAASGISYSRQTGRAVMLLAAILFLALAVARPQLGTHMEMMKREGIDIIVAVDVSPSMEALDVKPGPISRLAKAKQEIRSLIDPERLQGDRVGLVTFSGEAFIQCPLTLDYAAARMFLDVIDPEIIPVPGTAIGEAIRTATSGFDRKERKHKVLILLTDGEDHDTNPIGAADAARQEGVKIYTVGIGNPEGEPIPIYNQRDERIGFKKDGNGEIIVSKMDETTLQKIALTTGGKYYRATADGRELDSLLGEIDNLQRAQLQSRFETTYIERFQMFLALAVGALLLAEFIPDRKASAGQRSGRKEAVVERPNILATRQEQVANSQ